MGKQGVLGPKIRIGPKGYCRPKKRRQEKKSKYEFVLDLWIRIRIFTTNSVWAASQIRIGPLIFPPYNELGRGYSTPLPMYAAIIYFKPVISTAHFRKFLLETIKLCKKLRPKAKWGFYDYPSCNYDAGHQGETECSKKYQSINERFVICTLYFL